MAEALSRSSYLSRNVGDFPAEMEINGRRYVKIDDLRYGTNPHQPAASYRPADEIGVIGGMEVLKNGKNGLKTVTYQYKLVDGAIVDTQIVDETITLEPVSAVKTVGTKVTATSASTNAAATAANSYIANKSKYVSTLTPSTDIALDSNGVPVSYKNKITGLASAYTWTGNKTATGKTPQPGYIAVNTKIIPLHTKLFIRSTDGRYWYGYAVAEDTGGFAKTTNRVVDLYFSTRSQCVNFGVRNVEINVLG